MSDTIEPQVIQLADELAYQPTDAQQKVKTAFWARVADSPTMDPQDTLSLASVRQFVSDRRLERWWKELGFKEWFQNRNEFQERVAYLEQKVLSRLEAMLDDPEAQDSAVVACAKIVLDLGKKVSPTNNTTDAFSKKIADMQPDQLEEFIRKNTKKLLG